MKRLGLLALVGALAFSCRAPSQKSDGPRHVVLVVWDGMRPDFITENGTPNLWKVAQEGVNFRRHHSMYPSMTNVNGTVLATGVFPQRSGVIGNNEFRPALDPLAPMDTAEAETIRRADEVMHGKYLNVATIAETLQADGKRTAVTGTKWVAALFDRNRTRTSELAKNSPSLTAGEAIQEETQSALERSLGAFPKKTFPNLEEDRWSTHALSEIFWRDQLPAFSLLWLSDPDFTAHESAPGAPDVLASIKNSDARLGDLLATLEAKHLRDSTDIFVVSDHGFSTIERAIDLPAALRAAGFQAAKRWEKDAKAGQILVAGNAGTSFFYLAEHDRATMHRLVEWLQHSDFAGVIFAREKMEGAFTLADARLEKPDGPDVIMSFRWNEKPNGFGALGMITADAARAEGKGTHATLSRYDVHNTLIAAGPDFRRGFHDETPTGNIDLAATILHLLKTNSAQPLDGRILSEALVAESAPVATETKTREATRDFPEGQWRQTLTISSAGDKIYFDEGNGTFVPTAR